jgi:hypothetical protein
VLRIRVVLSVLSLAGSPRWISFTVVREVWRSHSELYENPVVLEGRKGLLVSGPHCDFSLF